MLLLLLALAAEPPRVEAARVAASQQIQQKFAQAQIAYPPRRVLLRAFKQDRELELWAGGARGPLKLVTKYAICASSGTLGEKTRAGDGQVPEGFYEISGFNPSSNFLLSLRVSYPNARDRKLRHTGGDIFIHGSCVTIGCIPIEDGPIQELYVIASDANTAGARLPVYIFPARDFASLPATDFWQNLREGMELFDRTHVPLRVSVDARGRYHFAP
jgi:murein L,D-transpeptidase YafK